MDGNIGETINGKGAMNRRSFLAGAAGMGVAAMSGMLTACSSPKSADSKQSSDAQASTSTDWLGKAPDVGAVSNTITCDVLVIGGGTGGLFTACSAAEEGAHVVLLEKFAHGGGIRDDLGAANSRYQQADGCVIDKQAMAQDMNRYSNGYCNQKLHMLWYDNSADAINWYGDRVEERGVKMWHEAATENPDKVSLYKHWPTGHSPAWPMGSDGKQTLDGATVLTDYANKLGVEFHYETPMVKLAQENDKVIGAIAKQPDGSYIQVNASKGVVVCTGGYGNNPDMLKILQPETLSITSQSLAIPGTDGDGIKACLWAGARMDETHAAMLFDRSALAAGGYTEFGGDSKLFWMGSQPWLKVNMEGKRFANEGGGVYDYILHAASHESHHTYCTIFDSNYPKWAAQFDMHGCSRLFPFENGAPSNMTIQAIQGMNKGLLEQGYIQQADTIEELAEKMGLPKDALVATVKRNNELYDKGIDEDFGKEPFRLSRVDTPPYYGARQAGRLLCTMDGIIINEKLQALREDGTPIEGLYVIGNDSGGYYATSYPNQSTGNACGRTVTFGRLVGKQLAKK